MVPEVPTVPHRACTCPGTRGTLGTPGTIGTLPPSRYNRRTVLRALLLILFFASGAAALIYELVWFHLVTLVVGASSLSVAAILASFMGGMAIGSALLPRMASASAHPLRIVAAIEIGIAGIGLAMPFAAAARP